MLGPAIENPDNKAAPTASAASTAEVDGAKAKLAALKRDHKAAEDELADARRDLTRLQNRMASTAPTTIDDDHPAVKPK